MRTHLLPSSRQSNPNYSPLRKPRTINNAVNLIKSNNVTRPKRTKKKKIVNLEDLYNFLDVSKNTTKTNKVTYDECQPVVKARRRTTKNKEVNAIVDAMYGNKPRKNIKKKEEEITLPPFTIPGIYSDNTPKTKPLGSEKNPIIIDEEPEVYKTT